MAYSQWPSRLKCAFAFLHMVDAAEFASSQQRTTDILYRVRLISVAAAQGSTDWRLVNLPTTLESDWATTYWKNMTSLEDAMGLGSGHFREVLTLSPLRVEERLNLS
ncbi:MAG: hypothetical protein GDA50_04035 [Alphaproteobacteria bacterium GM202ARS2]|nr:hypothetical protein [Alphaproteobacteria bacterium GM202ARS2]